MSVRAVEHEMSLLGGWALSTGGRPLHLHLREQRVLALLGLRGPQSRAALAGTLWPDRSEARARASLRTSLLHIRRLLGTGVVVRRDHVSLGPEFAVDVEGLRRMLDLVEETPRLADRDRARALRLLRAPDLLLGWYDDWVLAERERLRHRRVRALERLARANLDAGRAADAVDCASEAAAMEPLLESAVTLHVRALLMDGDLTAALTQYRAFRERLQRELGVRPPSVLSDMLREAKLQRAAGVASPGAPVLRDAAVGHVRLD